MPLPINHGTLASAALLVLCAAYPIAAHGQGVNPEDPEAAAPLLIPQIQGPLEIDGRVTEAAWDEALPLLPVMSEPDYGGDPSEPTEFLVGHDGEFLYFACRAGDSDPSGIRAPSLRRNDGRFINDWCAIALDALLDGETALVFATTPAGIRTDAYFPRDATSGGNFDWNTFWDAAAARTEDGWSAEIRIPFSSLPLQLDDGRAVMGMTLWRNIARKNERVSYPAIAPRWGTLSILKASQMRTVVLEGVDARRAVHITPYGLAGTGHTHALDGDGSGFDRSSRQVGETGVDVHYGLGPNFSLDLSANTDFAQVEADDQQVNLTRFSLFFPEKRRFFQERSAVFEFSLGGAERLFHSRSVGLAQGEPVRIYGGGRLVGRQGQWDVGVLNMQTAGSELLPGENSGVVRLRRRVLNQESYAGGIFTSRLGRDGSRNLVYGTDAVLRLRGQDYLTLNWAQSFDDGEGEALPGSVGFLDRSLVRLRWERRGIDHLTYRLDLARAGEAFEPGLGFLFRRGFTRGQGGVGYGWRPGEGSRLLRYAVGVDASIFHREVDGRIETAAIEPDWVVETRGGHQVTASAAYRYEDVASTFRLSSDATVPAGTYGFPEAGLSYRPPQGGLIRPTARISGGRFFDGRRVSLSLSPAWAASRHLNLSGAYTLNRVTFPDRDQGFTAHVARLRAEVMLTAEVSWMGFVQYNSEPDRVVANFRFRYNPREGNDLFIVWNEGLNTDRFAHDPVRPRTDERTVLVKYSHTISLGL